MLMTPLEEKGQLVSPNPKETLNGEIGILEELVTEAGSLVFLNDVPRNVQTDNTTVSDTDKISSYRLRIVNVCSRLREINESLRNLG